MKFIITGSGGCVCTPKPLCQCKVCVQARKKGFPYARCGPSLYLEDASLLIDTPEDIAVALNNADIKQIDNIMYSHSDPDHSLGMRVFEQLRLEWLDYYDDVKPDDPITMYCAPDVMKDMYSIGTKFGPLLDYYKYMGLVQTQETDTPVTLGGVKITLVPIPKEKAVTVFVFEKDRKKLIYAPCDCVPFPDDEIIAGTDVLVIGNVFIGDTVKDNRIISVKNRIRTELRSFEETLELKEKIKAKSLVITHIEEIWGKSYDDYRALESKYSDVWFAYDGMEIVL